MIIYLLACAGFLLAGETTATYKVEGMMCGVNCPRVVQKSLEGVEGVKNCTVDFNSKTAYYDGINQSLLLESKGVGEMFKGQLTARAELFKAGAKIGQNLYTSGEVIKLMLLSCANVGKIKPTNKNQAHHFLKVISVSLLYHTWLTYYFEFFNPKP